MSDIVIWAGSHCKGKEKKELLFKISFSSEVIYHVWKERNPTISENRGDDSFGVAPSPSIVKHVGA